MELIFRDEVLWGWRRAGQGRLCTQNTVTASPAVDLRERATPGRFWELASHSDMGRTSKSPLYLVLGPLKEFILVWVRT